MEEPICYAQYFVNKQNIRSLNNILNSKLLKSENYTLFLQEMIEEENLCSSISSDLKEILFEVQQNIKCYGKYDFKNYFCMYQDDQKNLVAVDKIRINEGCWAAFSEILPSKFFGNNHNTTIFKKCIKIIIFSMRRQHLQLVKLVHKWDYHVYPWTTLTQSAQVLHKVLHWTFKVVLSAIISLNFLVTTTKLNNDENLLYFFWKNKWQSFYDTKISDMVVTHIINKFHSFRKNRKRKYSLQEKFKFNLLKRDIPKLYLVLKPNNSYRPIVRYKTGSLIIKDKCKMKERLYFLRKITGESHVKFEIQFTNLYFKWQEQGKPKLYFVKTDLSNTFGSISRSKLLKILYEKHQELQRTETSGYIKRKHAQYYNEFMAEPRKPLLIRAGSTVYEWKEGLVQGYKFSPALSELFYSYMDRVYLSKHINENHLSNQIKLKLFVRVVDDYLYVTDSLEDACMFVKAISNYRNINYSKTAVNFSHEDIKYSKEITFLGYSYNTDNLQVSRANSLFTGHQCYKINFSAFIVNLNRFLENRIGQTGIQINGHLFNFHFNDEKLIWQHIFVTLCLSANKFCTILSIVCDDNDMLNYLSVYKDKVAVKLCKKMIEALKKNSPRDFCFVFCINHFRYLSFKALLLCARKTYKCSILVPQIKIELSKANCIYSKWRDHGGLISKHGKILARATREICRKADIRQIFKNFESLPDGFQCYNHRTFYETK